MNRTEERQLRARLALKTTGKNATDLRIELIHTQVREERQKQLITFLLDKAGLTLSQARALMVQQREP